MVLVVLVVVEDVVEVGGDENRDDNGSGGL